MTCKNNIRKRKPFYFILAFSVIWGVSEIALATSASVSLSATEGLITVSNAASFSTYEFCSPDDPPACHDNSHGTLVGYRDGSHWCSDEGNGSAFCSYGVNTARMQNGTHTFVARATDCKDNSSTDSVSINVDNTPDVYVNTPFPGEEVAGEFDISGLVNFKDNPEGAEGEIYIYLDGSMRLSKYCEGTEIPFSYNTANPTTKLNAGRMTNGPHTVTVRAVAKNGTKSEKTATFIVDNTPEITISTPSPNEKISGKFDFTGSVSFKENPVGAEGTITYYLDGKQRTSKTINGTDYTFSFNTDNENYRELDPALYGYWEDGFHSLSLKAVSTNGSRTIKSVLFIVGCQDPGAYGLDYDGDGINDCMDACPQGYGNAADGCEYIPLDLGRDPKGKINCNNVAEKGDPVSIYTGNLVESEADLDVPSPFAGGLIFKRFYNSRSEVVSPMGYGWTHNYNITLQSVTGVDSEYLLILDDTGFGRYFKEDPNTGTILPLFQERTNLIARDDTYIWERENGNTYTFDATTRQLLYITDHMGNRRTMVYGTTEPGLIETVIDEASGRSLVFAYTDGFLTSIRLLSGILDGGIQVAYDYDENKNLTTATFADGSGFVYDYDDADTAPFINNLTKKTDTMGHLLATWVYDDQDRCYRNDTTDGRGVTIDYDTIANAAVVTDAYGVSRTYQFTAIKGRRRIFGVTGDSGCAGCVEEPIRWEYDEHLNVIEMEYANGRIDLFSDFDDRGNAGRTVRAAGTGDEKEVISIWHPTLNKPLTRIEQSVLASGNKMTTWDYDDDGDDIANEDPTPLVHRLIVGGFTQDASGAVAPVESVTTFAYNTRGQLKSVDGPLSGTGDTTTCTYDSITGDLLGVTRPVSGTTTFSEHDAAGRPGRITDPNLNSVDYGYDGRGRVTAMTRQWDGATTGFSYTSAGMLDTVTLPNGATLTHEYDPATGRLTSTIDALGNRIGRGYDGQGNIIDTGYFLPSGTRTFRQRFDYQHPSRPGKLYRAINPDDTFFAYDYDAAGNVRRVTDPAGKITTYAYDLMNRMTAMVQPGSVVTGYDYDEQGNLVLVTDPENVATQYVVDDLGRTVRIVSPDAGTTAYLFDEAGNPVSKTDGNGIIVNFAYDDEYRLTDIAYADPKENVTYTYDAGENGKGRLTGIRDSGGSCSFSYDPSGNLIQDRRTMAGSIYTISYEYDAADVLTGITYPDGRQVDYELDGAGRVVRITTTMDQTTQIVAEEIEHLPFGPVADYTNGSGIRVIHTFDDGYRTTGVTAPSLMDRSYTLDPMGNITAITDTQAPDRFQSFQYDDLYRLTQATGIYGTIGYAYDGVGNRLTRTVDGQTETYQYHPGTHRLQTITGALPSGFTFDDAGNMTATDGITYAYNRNNRLIQVSDAGGSLGEYMYNSLGQRTRATTADGTTVFHYDQFGHLIGESTIDGDFIAHYIYLGDHRLAAVAATPVSDEFTVTVSTSQGMALSGIRVYAFTESGAYTGRFAVTDDTGEAAFNPGDFSTGGYTFRADYLSDRFWSSAVTLPGATSAGIVIDVETVEVLITQADGPKAGVRVYLFNEAGAYLGIFAITDENGNVSFILPAGQGYRFRADVLGGRFMSDVLTVSPDGANDFAVATGGGTLTVTLTTQDHTPLDGIHVYLFSSSGAYLGASGRTDPAGRVSYTVPEGMYKVRADYMGYQFWTEEIAVTTDTVSELIIDHQDVGITVLRDCNADVRLPEQVPVYLFTASGSHLGINAFTDDQGQTTFQVPAGEYKVRVDFIGGQYWSAIFNQNDETVTIDEGIATVSVTGQGLPLGGVNVHTFNEAGAYLGLSGQTDSQGEISFRLPRGNYNFRADYLGSRYFSGTAPVLAHVDNPVTVSTGGGNLTFTMEKSPGNPMAGISCYLFSDDGVYLGQSAATGGDGTADFHLADGGYQIRVDYLGYRYWTDAFSVPATDAVGMTIAHEDVVITVAGNDDGDMEARDSVPVYLFTPDGAYLGMSAVTDAAGQASFNLPAQAYTVRADYMGRQYWTDPVTLADADILIEEGTAAVTVLQEIQPLENVSVYVFGITDAYLNISGETDARGEVNFRLPQGTYRFRADHMGNQFWATATVAAHGTTPIAVSTGGGSFALTVQTETGAPLVDVPVYVFNDAGAYLGLSAHTDDSGQVAFDLADGGYRFRVDYLGYRYWTPDHVIPDIRSDLLTITHQMVTVTVDGQFGPVAAPLADVPVYLFSAAGAYMGRSAFTDADGQATFNLPPADYAFRADCLSVQTWSEVINQTDTIISIEHGRAAVHVTVGGWDLFDAPVYLFSESGAYLGRMERTDSSGMADFLVPDGAYKFRVDHDGSQVWSPAVNIMAGENTNVEMDLDILLADMTLSPFPVRFDGTPPVFSPEPILLASFGPLTGILPEAITAQRTVDKLYFFINDHLGTPIIITDEFGDVVWQGDYRPFGQVDITANGFVNNFRFPGQCHDGETGLHYNYHRYYDPRTGRYMRTDPIGLVGGINVYGYVGNNPVNWTDPMGLEAFGPEMIENFVPDSTIHYSRTNVGGSILFTDYSTQIHNRNGNWFSTKTDIGVSTSLIGGGTEFVFNISDLNGFNAIGNLAFTFGLNRYLGISYYPLSGQFGINVGLGITPPINISKTIDTIDHNKCK